MDDTERAIYAAVYGARMERILHGSPAHEQSVLRRLKHEQGMEIGPAMSETHRQMQEWYSEQAGIAIADAQAAVRLHRGE